MLQDEIVTVYRGRSTQKREEHMETTGGSAIQVRHRVIVSLIILPLFLGLAGFMNILRDPRFQDIRSLDVVRLIAIGACRGVVVVGLALLVRSKVRKG